MKGEVMPSIVKVEATVLKDLMTEVKETIAKEFIQTHVKSNSVFTAACLWKIESRRKRAMRTRKKFVL